MAILESRQKEPTSSHHKPVKNFMEVTSYLKQWGFIVRYM